MDLVWIIALLGIYLFLDAISKNTHTEVAPNIDSDLEPKFQ